MKAQLNAVILYLVGDGVDQTLRLERVDGQIIASFGDLARPDDEVTVADVEVVGDDTTVGDWHLF